jgi:hypothetical protein
MHDLQMTIDGTYEPACEYAFRKLIEDLPPELPTRTKARIGIMRHPQTDAFLKNACAITEYDPLRALFREYLDELPAADTIARTIRDCFGDGNEAKPRQELSGAIRAQVGSPEWYLKYLKTKHWKETALRAKHYYGGCVLCPEFNNLEVHHRHYWTLTTEAMRDLSVLCADHHRRITPLMSIAVPRQMPEEVGKLFAREAKTL